MHLDELWTLLRRRPFVPFRIFVTDGGSYEVQHPELCLPGTRSVFIGFPAFGLEHPAYERFVIIDRSHITRVEYIEQSAPAPDGGNGAGAGP